MALTSPDSRYINSNYPFSNPHEPMTIGSPTSPPSSGTAYLPGFLMGDPSTPSAGAIPGGSSYNMYGSGMTTSGLHRQVSSPSTANGITGSSSSGAMSQGLMRSASSMSHYGQSPRSSHVGVAGPQGDRARRQAPPTASLWATVATPPYRGGPHGPSGVPMSEPPVRHSTPTASTSMRHEAHRSMMAPTGQTPVTPAHLRIFREPSKASTVFSPAQIDPFYTQGESLRQENILDETWVTIFGFPTATASYILQQFAQYGTIEKHIIANDGNWMHLKYQTRLQAKKALSKSGKIFGSNIMVGVQPCIDTKLMTSQQLGYPSSADGLDTDTSSCYPGVSGTPRSQAYTLFTGPGGVTSPSSALAELSLNNSTHQRTQLPLGATGVQTIGCAGATPGNTTAQGAANSSMRSLTLGFNNKQLPANTTSELNESQQNNSLISKAVGYMFGW